MTLQPLIEANGSKCPEGMIKNLPLNTKTNQTKTVLVEAMKGQKIGFTENSPVIDEVVVLRLGAMSSEDFIIPFVKERETLKDGHKLKEKVVETAELSIFKAAKDNPHKNYLLFLDKQPCPAA